MVDMAIPGRENLLEARFTGRVAANGLLSKDVQTWIPKLAQLDLPAVTRVVVDAMRVSGVAGIKLPPPAGNKTPELLEHVRFVAVSICDAYHRAGGVLTARCYRTVGELAELLYLNWCEQVPPPIEVSWLLDKNVDAEEKAQRLTLCAQAVRDVLLAHAQTEDRDGTKFLVLSDDLLEHFCVKAAGTTVRVFDDPNGYVHTRAHGSLD